MVCPSTYYLCRIPYQFKTSNYGCINLQCSINIIDYYLLLYYYLFRLIENKKEYLGKLKPIQAKPVYWSFLTVL